VVLAQEFEVHTSFTSHPFSQSVRKSMTTETIGFIGIGSQGGPMAHRIIDASMPLVVWARRREVLAPYEEKGATIAGTVSELGAQCHLSVVKTIGRTRGVN
jgi:hypothetical protein